MIPLRETASRFLSRRRGWRVGGVGEEAFPAAAAHSHPPSPIPPTSHRLAIASNAFCRFLFYRELFAWRGCRLLAALLDTVCQTCFQAFFPFVSYLALCCDAATVSSNRRQVRPGFWNDTRKKETKKERMKKKERNTSLSFYIDFFFLPFCHELTSWPTLLFSAVQILKKMQSWHIDVKCSSAIQARQLMSRGC